MNHLPGINVMDETAARLACIRLRATCSREDAAFLLNIPPKTFDDWRGRGLIPAPGPNTKRWSGALPPPRLGGEAETGTVAPANDLQAWRAARGKA